MPQNLGSNWKTVDGMATRQVYSCSVREVDHLRAVYTVAWSLPADQIVAPGETVAFTACCLPATASGQDLVSRQLLVQESVVCP